LNPALDGAQNRSLQLALDDVLVLRVAAVVGVACPGYDSIGCGGCGAWALCDDRSL
jgi:hypothetical protein